MTNRSCRVALLGAALGAAACSPATHSIGNTFGEETSTTAGLVTGTPMTSTSDGGTATADTANEAIFDVGVFPDVPPADPMPACTPDPDADATLTGTVYAPNGTLPISGALVYTATEAPPGIPDQVYCAECVEPPCDPDWTLTDADGSFSVDSIAGGDRYLVVRKGNFMRVTPIEVVAGTTAVDSALTTLPGVRDADNGLYIPKIAVTASDEIEVHQSYDPVWEVLATVGLAQTDALGQMVSGTEQFHVTRDLTVDELFGDPSVMDQYQVILIPCLYNPSGPTGWSDYVGNVQDWVAKGGKLYVTDLSLDAADQPFGQYQALDWSLYAPIPVTATVRDAGLLAWLEALPEPLKDINPLNPGLGVVFPTLDMLPQFLIRVGSGVTIADVFPVLVDDGMGGQVDVGHRVFLDGEAAMGWQAPVMVKGEYGCGRIMASSHHTIETPHHGLDPTELSLVYMLLELTTCQTPQTVPPPAG